MSLITEISARFSLKVITNTGWLLFDNFIRVAAGFIVFTIVARHFGPEIFGIYSWLMALISLFLAFSGLGLREVIVRDLVKSTHEHSSLSICDSHETFFWDWAVFLVAYFNKFSSRG